MDPAQRVGVKDVARLAGVSQGTVSNVLNHPERVSSARREAVEEAIRELGFVRHEAARHLRAGYSSTIGLLLLDAWNPGFTDVARGVEDATAKQGMTVLISNSARDLEREKTYLRLFAEQRVAGVIVIPHDEYNERVHQIRAGGMPVVVVDRAETGADAHSLCVDDVAGGELAARYLMSLGHRHLAFIGDEALAIPVHDRLAGVRKAVAEVEFETGETDPPRRPPGGAVRRRGARGGRGARPTAGDGAAHRDHCRDRPVGAGGPAGAAPAQPGGAR